MRVVFQSTVNVLNKYTIPINRQLNAVQKDPLVSHSTQLTTKSPCPSGAICTEVSVCFPQLPHLQQGSSDAGREQSMP